MNREVRMTTIFCNVMLGKSFTSTRKKIEYYAKIQDNSTTPPNPFLPCQVKPCPELTEQPVLGINHPAQNTQGMEREEVGRYRHNPPHILS